MKKTIYPSSERGIAEHGWLHARHSFSFGSYQDESKMNFGLLRVINDDIIEAGKGFATHPHKNMEIVSIPLQGALAHKDSEGHEGVIRKGEVQLMSAGSGIRHSEFNPNDDQITQLFQIWVMPEKLDIEPRYEQSAFPLKEVKNQWVSLVSPIGDSDEKSLKINQQAYFQYASLEEGQSLHYNLRNPQHGVYLMVVEGEVQSLDEKLGHRDAIGVYDIESLEITAKKGSEVLLMEIPMTS